MLFGVFFGKYFVSFAELYTHHKFAFPHMCHERCMTYRVALWFFCYLCFHIFTDSLALQISTVLQMSLEMSIPLMDGFSGSWSELKPFNNFVKVWVVHLNESKQSFKMAAAMSICVHVQRLWTTTKENRSSYGIYRQTNLQWCHKTSIACKLLLFVLHQN